MMTLPTQHCCPNPYHQETHPTSLSFPSTTLLSTQCLQIRQRLVCRYTTKSLDTMTKRRVQQSMPPTSRYIKGMVSLIKCQFHTLLHDRTRWKHCNPANLEILKTVFEWDLKFYFLHMKSNEVGTTLKHPETINGNVKNLSKRMKMKDKGECHFYLIN
jgi:hypothetical protein